MINFYWKQFWVLDRERLTCFENWIKNFLSINVSFSSSPSPIVIIIVAKNIGLKNVICNEREIVNYLLLLFPLPLASPPPSPPPSPLLLLKSEKIVKPTEKFFLKVLLIIVIISVSCSCPCRCNHYINHNINLKWWENSNMRLEKLQNVIVLTIFMKSIMISPIRIGTAKNENIPVT